jgi:hypothetical protein
MNALSKLSMNILTARRERDNAVTPEAFRMANIRVAAAFEAWRTVAHKGAR